MAFTKYFVRFKLCGDLPSYPYRTLTFVWKLTFNSARSRILGIIERKFGVWTEADIWSEDEKGNRNLVKTRTVRERNYWIPA
jgi:hypothetical protein